MTVALALDIAMHTTGWALGGEDWGRPQWGVFKTKDWKTEQEVNLHAFRQFLDSKANTFALTHLVIEDIFVDNRNGGKAFNFSGTQAQLMLAGVALEWAYGRKITPFLADIDHWRMRFLGINRRPKDSKSDENYWKWLALKVAAQRNWFCTVHDEAEALGILDYALHTLSPAYRLRTDHNQARRHSEIDLKRGVFA